MDCQKLIVYGIVALVGLYLLRETCGIKLPFIDSFEGYADSTANVESAPSNVVASEGLGKNERFLPVSGMNRTPTSCYPQNTLTPDDLLPKNKSQQIKDFNNANPTGEGILKGVNYLDAGFHVGVNTVGQSLRNANLNLRAEPPNPQVKVSPWMNSTIAPDLSRKSLDDETVCNARPQGGALNGFDGNGSVPGSA